MLPKALGIQNVAVWRTSDGRYLGGFRDCRQVRVIGQLDTMLLPELELTLKQL